MQFPTENIHVTTAAEFFALPETNLPIHLIDGELIAMPAPTPSHQQFVFRLAKLIEKAAGQDTHIYIAPVDVYLDDKNVVQPDICWLAPDTQCNVEENFIGGAPDLVIEILSPSTARLDKTHKMRLYEKHGTREYWIVDTANRYLEIWLRDGDHFVTPALIFTPDDTFPSSLFEGQVFKGIDIFP